MRDSPPQRVTISQRSRPLRFGYLLRGFNDRRGLRSGIRLFTSLWGGMYNCFVPVYRRRPRWLRGSESGPAITRGYLDAFEPDYLIAEDTDLAEGLDYEKNRVLSVADVIREDHLAPFSHGIGVHRLFAWMWDNDFQYVKRTPPEIAVPRPTQRRFGALVATCFGEYPAVGDRRPDFESEFKRVFDAKDMPVDPNAFVRLAIGSVASPLAVGCAHLEVPTRRGPFGRELFFLDPGSTPHLVDYWNLRAFGMNPIVIPFPWFDELKDRVRRLVQAAHQPHPTNPDRMLWTTALSGQSHDPSELAPIVASLRGDAPDSIRSEWYPRIWAKAPRFVYQPRRGRVVASRGETEVTLRDGYVGFRGCDLPVKPNQFAQENADSVRVIQVRDWTGLSGSVAAFPPDLKSAKTVVESLPMHEVWFSSEGMVTTCRGEKPRFMWKLPTSREVCAAWLEQHGCTLEVTSAGKLLDEAIRRLGGLHGGWLLARKELVDLLNRMAGRPDQPAKTSTGSELVQRIQKTTENRDQAIYILRRLIRARVLEVGVEMECPHCGQSNWYRLKALGLSLLCHRCRQDFDFPADHPPSNPWRYRTVGPFAVENHIMGGISVLLSMIVLGGGGGSFPLAGITWCPSFELKRNGVDWCEIDALAFIERKDSRTGSGLPVFVEAKSYGENERIFKSEDIDRMREIGQLFPGSVLVFATLSPQLTRSDKDLIRPLAEQGREPFRGDDWTNPVVVLTGVELYSESGPPYCWDEIPDGAEVGRRFRAIDGLSDLADATQQLHLCMEPYSEYLRRWVEQRHRT